MAKSKNAKPKAAAIRVGEHVQVEWQGQWWPAEIMAANENGTYHIHYTGWDASFDEVVPARRVSQGQPVAAAPLAAPAPPPPGPIGQGPLDQLLLGDPVTDKTKLKAGDKVHVLWNQSWWAGEILAVSKDGVRIHYSGWGSEYDETVPRSRLQLPAHGHKLVIFHFERDWALTGRLLQILPDGFVISRAEDHKVCLVSRQGFRYLETEQVSEG